MIIPGEWRGQGKSRIYAAFLQLTLSQCRSPSFLGGSHHCTCQHTHTHACIHAHTHQFKIDFYPRDFLSASPSCSLLLPFLFQLASFPPLPFSFTLFFLLLFFFTSFPSSLTSLISFFIPKVYILLYSFFAKGASIL